MNPYSAVESNMFQLPHTEVFLVAPISGVGLYHWPLQRHLLDGNVSGSIALMEMLLHKMNKHSDKGQLAMAVIGMIEDNLTFLYGIHLD